MLPVCGAEIANEMSYRLGLRVVPAPYALPAGFAMFLAVGTAAAALHGRLTATGVLIGCAAVAFAVSFAAEPAACALLAGIGWLTVIGFSRPPYAQLRPGGPAAGHAAVVLAVSALAGAVLGLVFRWYCRRLTLVSMGRNTGMRRGASAGIPDGVSDAASGASASAAAWCRSWCRDRRPAAAGGRAAGRGPAAAAHRGPGGRAGAPEPGRLRLGLPGRGGGDHGGRRLLARRARRRRGQPPAQLVLHRADPHVHHRPAARTAGPAAVRDRRGRGQQRGPPGRPARRAGGPGQGGGGLAARAGADRAGRRRLPRGRARAPHPDPRRPGRAAGTSGRPVGADRVRAEWTAFWRQPPASTSATTSP